MLDKDYAIQLAMEYGFTGGFDAEGNLTFDAGFVEAVLEAIAKEREACAKECEHTALRMGSEWMAQHCANAIRQRGEA